MILRGCSGLTVSATERVSFLSFNSSATSLAMAFNSGGGNMIETREPMDHPGRMQDDRVPDLPADKQCVGKPIEESEESSQAGAGKESAGEKRLMCSEVSLTNPKRNR